MVPYSVAIIPLVTLLALFKIIKLVRNVFLARTTGLPYVVTPVLETEVLGLLATPVLRTLYHNHLDKGKGWPRWCRFVIKDWQWEDKRLVHDELGDTFLCVSPEGIICYSADATVGWDVMNRRNDFTKPRDKYSSWFHLVVFSRTDFQQNFWSHMDRMLLRLRARRTASMYASQLPHSET